MSLGPGEYVPDPTEGIIHICDLPAPQIAIMSIRPVLDAVIWPIAINGGIGRCTIWGICIAIAPSICS